MKLKYFASISIFSIFFLIINFKSFAGEPLVKYEQFFITNPATGVRVPDGSNVGSYGITNVLKLRPNPIASVFDNPNKPMIGYPDDCYPDDPGNPEGNIVISGRIISNFTNKPVNGAVVAIYMGAEQTGNIGDIGDIAFTDRFVHGGKDENGRLTNLYYYDISKDGFYRVFACNAYKTLSERRKAELKKYSPNLFNFKNKPCTVDGYSGNSSECTNFDYVRAYPKFNLAVICGLQNVKGDHDNPSPILGEIYSIDNYNDDYKSAYPPSYMRKKNFDIRVNCDDNISAFPLPTNLLYDSPTNISSCRIDDISPTLQNYFTKVQQPLKNDFQSLESMTQPNSSVFPDETKLSNCTNPDDIYCLKNFITKSFPKPKRGVNVFDYGNKTVLDPVNSNPITKDFTLTYKTGVNYPQVDLSDEETPGKNDWIPLTRDGTEGQLDAKVDMKSFISDYKFDINTLKDLYACFTTFNAPQNKSNAEIEELKRKRFADGATLQNEFYANNLRVPTCRELYCGTEFVPDNSVCKVKNPELVEKELGGKQFNVESPYDDFTQLNALTGYGPGVTLNFKNLEQITNDLLLLSKDLINSDFNPKKSMPAGVPVLYKPVSKIGDIVACLDDNNQPIYLNEASSGKKEGSITYKVKGQDTTFFSPVPLMSFISVPYTMELFHSIEGDSYANRLTSLPSTSLLFPEQCNLQSFQNAIRNEPGTNKTQLFANCRKAVIPGGVYSISALRVIANICSNIVKIPTADAGVFNRVVNVSQKNEYTASAYSYINDGIDVELSVTKIGTPVSMCLCKDGDKNCSLSSSLNNKSSVLDFAISSIVGDADQNKKTGVYTNALGFKCDNYHLTKTSKEPAINCQLRISNLGEWNIPNDSDHNFVGPDNNLHVVWPFAQSDFGDHDTVHQFLTYSYTGSEAPDPDKYKSYVKNGANGGWGEAQIAGDPARGARPCKEGAEVITWKDKDTGVSISCNQTGYKNGEKVCLDPETDRKDVKYECVNPRNIRPEGIGLDKDPKQISSLTNRTLDFDKGDTEIPNIDKLDPSAGAANNFVSPEIRVVQTTFNGTQGRAYGRYRMRTAKYDPIPDLLNDFRKYSVYGAVPGNGGEYCRTPKLGSNMDIDTYKFNIRASANTSESNDTYTAGIHCNSAIPEELERCEDPKNWPQAWIDGWNKEGYSTEKRKSECRKNRCIIYCQGSSRVSKPVDFYERNNPIDPSRSDYFCRNYGATKGIEFQVNSGNEGCVVDYSGKMKQNYANPAEVNYNYISAFTQPKFSKENYPVFNNRFCKNPSYQDYSNRNLGYDKSVCKPFVQDSYKGYEEYKSKGTKTPNN